MTATVEVNPAADWCQRWHHRQHSWQHRSDAARHLAAQLR